MLLDYVTCYEKDAFQMKFMSRTRKMLPVETAIEELSDKDIRGELK